MSKKSRHARKNHAPRLSAAQMVQPGTAVSQPVEKKEEAKPAAKALPNLREEYRYVLRDLKTIAIIAAVMLVGMIVVLLLL